MLPHDLSAYSELAGDEPWRLDVQGKRVTLSKPFVSRGKKPFTKRGDIVEFSIRARRRMLRRVAEIDWPKTGGGLFVTLTYPDAKGRGTMKSRTMHRSLFLRDVEKYTGKKIPVAWRVEWLERKSGKWQGKSMPHVHMILLGVRWIPKETIRDYWRKATGSRGLIIVDVQALDENNAQAIYIAKYCAKKSISDRLVNVPYWSKSGRHAGWRRVKHIPMAPRKRANLTDQAIIEFLRERAAQLLKWYRLELDDGFTLLGIHADEVRKEIEALAIDVGGNFWYEDVNNGD